MYQRQCRRPCLAQRDGCKSFDQHHVNVAIIIIYWYASNTFQDSWPVPGQVRWSWICCLSSLCRQQTWAVPWSGRLPETRWRWAVHSSWSHRTTWSDRTAEAQQSSCRASQWQSWWRPAQPAHNHPVHSSVSLFTDTARIVCRAYCRTSVCPSVSLTQPVGSASADINWQWRAVGTQQQMRAVLH